MNRLEKIRIMRIKLLLIVILCSAVTGFLTLSLSSGNTGTAHAEIQENLTDLLDRQLSDLTDFEYQLSVYSNPFSIRDPRPQITKRVYLNGGLIYWNNNENLPEYGALKQKGELYSIWGEFGTLMVRKKEIATKTDLIEIFSIVPVYTTPPVVNQYLKERLNPEIFKDYLVEVRSGGAGFPLGYDGYELFSIELIEERDRETDILLFVFLMVACCSLISLVFRWINRNSWQTGIKLLTLIAVTILLRLVIHWFTRSGLLHWELFNPVYFTNGIFYHTLGDLLLNGLCVFVFGVFAYYFYFYQRRLPELRGLHPLTRSLLAFSICATILWLAYLTYVNVWIILENSQIELDIGRSIQFDPLRISAYLFLIIQGLVFLIAFSMAIRIIDLLKIKLWMKYAAMLSAFLAMVLINGTTSLIYLGQFMIIWLIIDFFGLGHRPGDIRYKTFLYLIFTFMAVAWVSTHSIYKHYEKDVLVAKEKFGNRLLIKNDILGELYLREIIEEIEEDRYIRSRLLSKLLARQNIREKIKRQFMSSYFKKYDINVFLFDDRGNSLHSTTGRSLAEFEEQYRKERYATDYPKIYFIQDADDNVRNKYVCFIAIEAFGRRVGDIVLELTLKKYIPNSVFPELLLENRFSMGNREEFDYAVYKNGEILYKQGRLGFETRFATTDFQNNDLYKQGLERGGTHYFGVRTIDGRTILIVSPTYSNEALLANFSLIFLVVLFASAIFFLFLRIGGGNPGFNLSTKIQLYLGLSFIIPMLIVGIALLNTLNQSYREEIDRNFQKRSFNLAENLIDRAEAFATNLINIDVFANEISEAAALAQSDINVYDTEGRLITSSQPEIFRIGILSGLLDPEALYVIRYKKEQNLISERRIGELDFKTSFTALRSYHDGRLLGILSMPYFDSKNHLRRQQIEVFNNLLVIFTGIFLIALIGGNLIVGQLVKPLKRIGQSLRNTSLQEENQPISYEAQDEIGSLVREYNQMIGKLEQSKAALALSQKESAWKEIARQVAHEIKNPLTPMRLKIQQMMKSFGPEEKTYKTCELLIHQIDSLGSIADSFSEFAKMPVPQPESIDILVLLDSVLDLHVSRKVQIHRTYPDQPVLAFIDPKIFGRIFTNIVLNAIQSRREGVPVIEVSVSLNQQKALIAISDNGEGISEDVKENIFTPYFSTKTKGSGIGLAVAKKGIENAGGHIWFESEVGEGTTFYISLPNYLP